MPDMNEVTSSDVVHKISEIKDLVEVFLALATVIVADIECRIEKSNYIRTAVINGEGNRDCGQASEGIQLVSRLCALLVRKVHVEVCQCVARSMVLRGDEWRDQVSVMFASIAKKQHVFPKSIPINAFISKEHFLLSGKKALLHDPSSRPVRTISDEFHSCEWFIIAPDVLRTPHQDSHESRRHVFR